MVIVFCDSSFFVLSLFSFANVFCDFFRLVNIFLGELDIELIFVNGLDSVGTFKFL